MAITLFGASTSLETVLDAIADKIGESGDTLLDDERVLVSLVNDQAIDQNPPGEEFVVITPREFSAITSMVSGGGNYKCGMSGSIEIDYWNRFEVDEVLRDRQALRDTTHGLLAKWKALMSSLQLYAPLNDSGRCILIEPMRIRMWSVQPRRPSSPWLVIKSQWECKFVQSLS